MPLVPIDLGVPVEVFLLDAQQRYRGIIQVDFMKRSMNYPVADAYLHDHKAIDETIKMWTDE